MATIREDLKVVVGGDIRGLNRVLGEASKKVGAFSNRIKKASFGIAGILAPSIFLGAGFEKQMKFTAALISDGTARYDDMMKTVRNLGKTTEWSAKQAAEGMQFLGMAGFTAQQSIDALPGVLELATAGMMDLGQAADIATNILTQMGLEVKELARINDVLTKVQSTSNTTIEQAAQAFIYGGTMAKQMGMSVEELAGFIGLLAKVGIRGSLAGTTLRQSMMKLLAPSREAKQIMLEVGLTVRDNEGKLRNFTELIKEMADSGMDAEVATKLLGARAGQLAVLFRLSGVQIQDYIDLLKDSEGAARSLADSIRNTLWGSFKNLTSALQEVGIAGFMTYKDQLKEATDSVVEFAREIGTWISVNNDLISQKVSTTISGIGAAIKTTVDLIRSNPLVAEFGILGWAIGGSKGLLIAAGIGKLAQLWIKFLNNIFPQTAGEFRGSRLRDVQEEIDMLERSISNISDPLAFVGLYKDDKFFQDRLTNLKAEKRLLEDVIDGERRRADWVQSSREGQIILETEITEWVNSQLRASEKLRSEKLRAITEALEGGAGKIATDRAQKELDKRAETYRNWIREKEALRHIDLVDYEKAQKAIADLGTKWTKKRHDDIMELNDEFKDWEEGWWAERIANEKAMYDLKVTLAKTAAEGMQGAFSTFFFDAIEGRMKTFGDYFTGFIKAIAKSLAELAASKLAGFLFSAITPTATATTPAGIGSAIAHSGGVVGKTSFPTRAVNPAIFTNAPRLHSGLSSDEFPAILQRGETVISRGGSRQPPPITINITNESGKELDAETQDGPKWDGQRWVMEMVLKGMATNQGFRGAIRSA